MKAVSTISVGYDHINVEHCRRNGICVGHTPGVLTDSTADLTVALILAHRRRLIEAQNAVRTGQVCVVYDKPYIYSEIDLLLNV